jgi:peptidyl-prolyl cis-trans isomerase A (cyclophilin A)
VFINYRDNAQLDQSGFTPFGEVIEGMEVVDSFYKGYGEGAPKGKGPDQMLLTREGNAYLERDFPELDWLKKAVLLEG